jgi:hypothetical protein
MQSVGRDERFEDDPQVRRQLLNGNKRLIGTVETQGPVEDLPQSTNVVGQTAAPLPMAPALMVGREQSWPCSKSASCGRCVVSARSSSSHKEE